MLLAVRRVVVGFLLALIAVPAAQAQDTGTYRSDPLDWGVGATAWTDFNADGKADYCRLTATSGLLCTLASGRGFGATISAPPHDPGYVDGRVWGDVDGNGGADYCRRVGDGSRQRFECTLSQYNAFAFVSPNQMLEWGELAGAALADVTGDGKADYCRLTADRAICSPWTATGFGPGFAAPVDVGDAAGRAWVDFNADGKADYCRITAGGLACTLSTGTGFGATVTTPTDDAGYPDGRAWVDIDGDRRADYCRRTGGGNAPTYVRCTLATPTGFGPDFTSAPLDWGAEPAAWVDFDGDGDRDYCRPVAPTPTNTQLFCTLWTPTGLGTTVVSGPIDLGYANGRAWVDHNGDGKVDYCRLVGDAGDSRVACTTSNGTAFGPVAQPVPPEPPAPPAPGPTAPTPIPKTRLVVTLSYDYTVKGRYTRISRLQVKGVPAGATVKATCKKGCSRKAYSVKKQRRGTASLDRLVKKRLRAGTTIRVVVSRPGNLAAIKTLKIRSGARPTVKTG